MGSLRKVGTVGDSSSRKLLALSNTGVSGKVRDKRLRAVVLNSLHYRIIWSFYEHTIILASPWRL